MVIAGQPFSKKASNLLEHHFVELNGSSGMSIEVINSRGNISWLV